VRVDGQVARDGRVAVARESRVTLGVPPNLPPPGLPILYEDGDLLVVDKPVGLLTIATERERDRTAYRLVWTYLAGASPPRRPFAVHRLDRETSGLLVIAKSVAAKRRLQAQFEARSVERGYVALVEGLVRADAGTLTMPVITDRGVRVRAARPREKGAREAITRYRVLERRAERTPERTLVALDLGTGRRRQIRVQLAALGHPIAGDLEHGGRRERRLWLHATRLGFVHPTTGRPARFESPPPAGLTPRTRGV
jgi:23S rRNA pseudouridine1911/1915/1917 synthase